MTTYDYTGGQAKKHPAYGLLYNEQDNGQESLRDYGYTLFIFQQPVYNPDCDAENDRFESINKVNPCIVLPTLPRPLKKNWEQCTYKRGKNQQ
jgi:hypothetical protein